MKGRKRIPTEQKIAEGNRGKRKLDLEKEPKFSKDALVPIKPLTQVAQEEWNRIAPIITRSNIFTDADTAALTAYCENFSTFVKATEEIERDGLYTSTQTGVTTHPAVRIQNQASTAMLKFLVEFGLTPASRSRVTVENRSSEDDSFANFVKDREKRRGELLEINRPKKTA